jgi:predicted CxxxxCH...CXXCH cytochrome family protein
MSSVGNHEVDGGSVIIDCTTCHNPHVSEQSTDPHTDITADNASLVRSTIAAGRVPGVLNPVIFQDPSHLAFGEDNPPWNAVCQACHTQTNHHTNDDSADHDHEIAGDCTGCHRHGDGFGLAGAACDFCHGYPPTQDSPGASDGLVYLPEPTGSPSAGAHSAHAITEVYACETCHNGGMPESPVFGNDLIQIGFNVFGSDGTGTSYDGQVLAPPYDYEGTNNTTVTATGSMTCENLYCHGTLADGTNWGDGNNTSPAWDGTLACGDCHLATNDNPPLLGSHEVHAGSAGLNLPCETCHGGYPDGHVNNQADIAFSSDPLLAGVSYNGTADMFDEYGQCSNIYCHSNVQDDTGRGGPTAYATPTWGDSLACNDCHSDPPGTGSHTVHANSGNYHFSSFWGIIDCAACHANSSHADGSIDVDAGQGYTHGGDPGNGYGTCANACHTGAVWGGNRLYCYDCHGRNNRCYECHPGMPSNARHDDDPNFPLPVQTPTTLVPEDDIESATPAEVTLEWNPVPPASGGETQYYAVVSGSPDFSSQFPSYLFNWSTNTQWTVTLDTSHTWYWMVKARDLVRPGLESGYSAVDSFHVSIPGTPLAPMLMPEPDITPPSDTPPLPSIELQWNPVSFSDPVEYYVEVDTYSHFPHPDFTSGWITDTSWSFVPPYFAPYWWRVKTRNALDPSKESVWSFVDTFRVWSPSGSCPFLYVWDGEQFTFQTDMYGPGKLGTLSSRGYLKPNPHDYYILETNPVEKDGQYQMRLVEERFETDYMDELKLYVIDIPMHRRIYAEKPGFGGTLENLQDVLHTTAQAIHKPREITHVNTGEDVSYQVASSDGNFLVLNEDNNIDFTYQTLELDLGDLSQALQIKLIIDGMTVFPSTPEGVDRASQFGPRTKLEVLDGNGEWVSVLKTTAELPKLPEFKRVFALDISDIFLTDVYKVRLTFLFKTYVDAIHFDTTQDQMVTLTAVPLLSAELRSYGLSDSEVVFEDIYNYLYRLLDPNHYHDYFPGNYTRYGDVTTLLSETEDFFVIYGQGDELDLRFDPAAPQPAGTYRAFLLYTNGYYKDAKVAVPHTVEPLPFKDMSNFPYDPAVENYPDDPEHNQYRSAYNTRVE